MSLFPPPQDLHAEVHTRLPECFREPRRSAWADVNKGGALLHSFLEGPAFDRAGNLFVTDIPFGRVFRVTPDGEWTLVAQWAGEPNDLKIRADGQLLVTDYRNGLMRIDPASGTVTPLLERVRLERFKGLNALAIANNGDVYLTDQGQTGLHDPSGRVYRLAHDGRVDRLIDNAPSPNGLALNMAETHLFVAMTRANQVWRLPLLADGGTSKVGMFVQLSGGLSGADGVAFDEMDNMAVAHAGMGSVWIFNRLGEPLYRVRCPEGLFPTALAYGVTEREMLYIVESETGTVYRVKLSVPGKRLPGCGG